MAYEMKVIISENGICIPDSKVFDFAYDKVFSNESEVSVGTYEMLNAFRVLKARGVIKNLTVMFAEDGSERKVLKNGKIGKSRWPKNKITDMRQNILSELIRRKSLLNWDKPIEFVQFDNQETWVCSASVIDSNKNNELNRVIVKFPDGHKTYEVNKEGYIVGLEFCVIRNVESE